MKFYSIIIISLVSLFSFFISLYSQPPTFVTVGCATGPQAGPVAPYINETDWYKLMHNEICKPPPPVQPPICDGIPVPIQN